MWLEQVNEISEMFRYSLPYYIAVLLPILIILSPADASHEFPVYRLQHFDLQGVKYGNWSVQLSLDSVGYYLPLLGSRSSILNYEARSMDTKLPARKCVILMINEFSVSRFRELVNEGVGAILIIIPADLDSITEDLKEVV